MWLHWIMGRLNDLQINIDQGGKVLLTPGELFSAGRRLRFRLKTRDHISHSANLEYISNISRGRSKLWLPQESWTVAPGEGSSSSVFGWLAQGILSSSVAHCLTGPTSCTRSLNPHSSYLKSCCTWRQKHSSDPLSSACEHLGWGQRICRGHLESQEHWCLHPYLFTFPDK